MCIRDRYFVYHGSLDNDESSMDKFLLVNYGIQREHQYFKTTVRGKGCAPPVSYTHLSIARRYRDKRGGNLILTQHFSIGWDGYRHKHNINVLVVGGSGAGKTRGYCVPNILEAAGRDQNLSLIHI